mmetsp:Transcript_47778/g.89010  ORF Transcript_47778/g.89010 Transcript_47778/m.89010 type:complete len:355 (-) Transcript_47778:393-1457(-)
MPEFNASVPLSVAFGAALGLGTALAAIQLVERRAKSHGDQSFCSQPPEITRDVRTGSMSSTGSSRPLFPITPRRASQSKKVASPRIESAIKGAPLPGKVSAMADNAAVEKNQELSNSSSGSSLQRVDSDANLVEMKQADLLRHLEHANGAHQPLVVGVAGGTGSGKTTLAKAIRESLELDCVSYVNHDNYYKDLRHLSFEERNEHNFDHPDALDTDCLFEHVLQLKSGKAVDVPTYDFSTHSRTDVTERVEPRQIILVEGILIFTHEQLRDLMDIRIFVDTADDVRLIRRLTRDMNERGRSTDSVIKQYMKTVRPMHLKFVEPSKQHADVIVPVGLNQAALDMIISRLRFAANV